jgi:hypothetical protein
MLMLAKTALMWAKGVAGAAGPWNSADKTANAVLTVGNTILNSNGSVGGVRGTVSHAASTGSWYFTIKFVGTPSSGNIVGLGTSTASLSTVKSTGQFGVASAGFAWDLWNNTGAIGSISVSAAAGATWGFAWDSTAGSLYIALNGTYYNASGGSVGSSPTVPTMSSVTGTLFPLALCTNTNEDVTLDTNPVGTPAGYTNWG